MADQTQDAFDSLYERGVTPAERYQDASKFLNFLVVARIERDWCTGAMAEFSRAYEQYYETRRARETRIPPDGAT